MNEFGEPRQYAESYQKGDRRTTGWWIITIAVTVAVLTVLIRVLGVVANLFEQSIGMNRPGFRGGSDSPRG